MPRVHQVKVGFGIVPREHSITPFHQIGHLISKGHKDITVAVGSDQLAKGGLKDQILKHMERHGGFVGPDKQVHDVTINFHQLGKPRVEGEIPREKILKQVRGGDYTGVKAGKLRAAVGSGDEELAHEMMPHSVKDKAGYFKLIKGQMDAVQRGIDAKRAEKEAKKAAKTKAKPKTKSKKKKVVKEALQRIASFMEATKDPTRRERDHRMYGWGKENPTPTQLANRKKKDKRTVARRKANASGRTRKGDKSVELDHKNGNANDNSSDNLRVISRKTNRSRNNNKWRK
jgi:hypothetical protein